MFENIAGATPWGAGIEAVKGFAAGGPSSVGDTASSSTGSLAPVAIGSFKGGSTSAMPATASVGGLPIWGWAAIGIVALVLIAKK